MSNAPLGIPAGSVRAILAIGVVAGAFVVYAMTSKLTFDQFIFLITPVLALYFGQYISAPGSPSVPNVVPVTTGGSNIPQPVYVVPEPGKAVTNV